MLLAIREVWSRLANNWLYSGYKLLLVKFLMSVKSYLAIFEKLSELRDIVPVSVGTRFYSPNRQTGKHFKIINIFHNNVSWFAKGLILVPQ